MDWLIAIGIVIGAPALIFGALFISPLFTGEFWAGLVDEYIQKRNLKKKGEL